MLLGPADLAGAVVASAAQVRGGQRPRKLAQAPHDRLVEAASKSAVQPVDETGWEISGRSAWPRVLADAHATLYRIRPNRAHVVVDALTDPAADGSPAGIGRRLGALKTRLRTRSRVTFRGRKGREWQARYLGTVPSVTSSARQRICRPRKA